MRWTVAWALGCAGSPPGDQGPPSSGDTASAPAPDCTSEEMALTVGWGSEAYVPLSDGDRVTMVHGRQGGWHLEAAGEVAHSRQEVLIRPVLAAAGGGEVLTTNLVGNYQALAPYDAEECRGSFYGVEAFFSAEGPGRPQQNICALSGLEATLTVEVTELLTGRTTSASASVVLGLDPSDEPLCP